MTQSGRGSRRSHTHRGSSSSKPRDVFERRAARNRVMIIFMAVLMALSLLAVPLTQLLS